MISRISRLSSTPERKSYCLSIGDYQLNLGEKTYIMGIINMTPDSFSNDGCFKNHRRSLKSATSLAYQMVIDGADVLDIGGESSRPGAKPISEEEEIQRVIPLIKNLAKKIKIPLSVDTYKPTVAKRALEAGVSLINNIKGASPDKELLKMISHYKAGIVLMHMRESPQTMQKNIRYQNLIREIMASLKKSIEICLDIGIKSDKILIDPGIGFGKTLEHNLEIINRLREFNILNKPILIGTSRKSFIGKILKKGVEERLLGTAASVCASIIKGAHVVRVHDVRAMKQVTILTDAILNQHHS